VDYQRLLVLRTGSDYCTPPPGQLTKDSINAEYPGYLPALEAAYRVGSPVVHELASHWDAYRDKTPAAN
jgi:purine nucleoside permease